MNYTEDFLELWLCYYNTLTKQDLSLAELLSYSQAPQSLKYFISLIKNNSKLDNYSNCF